MEKIEYLQIQGETEIIEVPICNNMALKFLQSNTLLE